MNSRRVLVLVLHSRGRRRDLKLPTTPRTNTRHRCRHQAAHHSTLVRIINRLSPRLDRLSRHRRQGQHRLYQCRRLRRLYLLHRRCRRILPAPTGHHQTQVGHRSKLHRHLAHLARVLPVATVVLVAVAVAEVVDAYVSRCPCSSRRHQRFSAPLSRRARTRYNST